MRKEAETSFFLNFDDPRMFNFEFNDFTRITDLLLENEYEHIYLDEIQLIGKWERFVRQLVDLQQFYITLSGSNASLLSRELGTHLTGRQISKELFPFSFKEFLSFHNQTASVQQTQNYLETGGFPEFVKTGIHEVITEVLNDIIYRDISVRYNVRNHHALKQLIIFLISNVGKLVTGNSLRKLISVSATSTVIEYLNYFENSYLMFLMPKFSYSYKKQIQNPKKVYTIDTGLVSINSISHSEDYGRRFENLVFLNLRRKYDELFYFSEKGECDFVVCKNGQAHTLIQVCYELTQDNLTRETEGLFEAMDFFELDKGTIVTLKQDDKFAENGKTIFVTPYHTWKL